MSDNTDDISEGYMEAKKTGYLEGARVSLRGFRDMIGMSTTLASLIDVLFMVVGLWTALSFTGAIQVIGLLAITTGAIGFIARIWRFKQ